MLQDRQEFGAASSVNSPQQIQPAGKANGVPINFESCSGSKSSFLPRTTPGRPAQDGTIPLLPMCLRKIPALGWAVNDRAKCQEKTAPGHIGWDATDGMGQVALLASGLVL